MKTKLLSDDLFVALLSSIALSGLTFLDLPEVILSKNEKNI